MKRLSASTPDLLKAFWYSIANYLLFYAIGILLARELGPTGYDDYNVALSWITILAALTTFGIEKYALDFLPSHYEDGLWLQASNYWKFGLRFIFILSVILAAGSWLGYNLFSHLYAEGINHCLEVILIFLPFLGITLFLIEIASVNSAARQATFYYLVLLPGVALATTLIIRQLPGGLDEHKTVLAYGFGWTLCLLFLWALVKKTMPAQMKVAIREKESGNVSDYKKWLKSSSPFMINKLLGTLMAFSGIIILEIVHQSNTQVGLFAAAFSTGSMVVPLGTSTNSFFLPAISVLLETKDHKGLQTLLKKRFAVIGGLSALFFVVILLFGKNLLLLFGRDFAGSWLPLVLIAGTNMISTAYSLAPFSLCFVNHSKLVTTSRIVFVAINTILCVWLGSVYGALGIAIAYTVSFGGFAILMQIKALQAIKAHFD